MDLEAAFTTSLSGLSSLEDQDVKLPVDPPGPSQEELREQLTKMWATNQDLLALNQKLAAWSMDPLVYLRSKGGNPPGPAFQDGRSQPSHHARSEHMLDGRAGNWPTPCGLHG